MSTRTTTPAVLLLAAAGLAGAADWPQWRGPDRTNVSKETGLLAEWPEGGPPLLWKAAGLGDGVAPVSVAGGRVLTTGVRGDDEFCVAVAEADGTPLWAAKIGPSAKESSIMRWLSQRAPTVDADRVYAVSAAGDYACLAADTGAVVWRKHYQADFGGKRGPWGFCDYPLVDGDRVVVCPGGDTHTIAALDRRTGAVVWACPIPGERAAHSVLVAAEVGGVRQYVVHLWKGLYGVAAADGKQLWSYAGLANGTANTHAPVVRGDAVFYANGYQTGHALLKVTRTGDAWAAAEVYRGKVGYVSWLGSPTAVGDHLYLTSFTGLACLDQKTGMTVWEQKVGRCMPTAADGKLVVRTQAGPVVLAAADPGGFKELGKFTPPRADPKMPAWTYPLVANGRLYLRDYDALYCYDLRDPERRKKVPGAVFVPTPDDVVARMLELAKVTKADTVYDLGSGDGRVVIAAVKARGCRAVGVELDKDLVALSRRKVREAGVGDRVAVEHADLFDADIATADVIALYLPEAMNRKLIPKLEALKPGSRVVCHHFPIPGVVPDKEVKVTSAEDDVERSLYLYRTPLRKVTPSGR